MTDQANDVGIVWHSDPETVKIAFGIGARRGHLVRFRLDAGICYRRRPLAILIHPMG